jgi:hypothetical protein
MAPEPASTAYTPQPRGEANIAKTTPTAAAIASTTTRARMERITARAAFRFPRPTRAAGSGGVLSRREIAGLGLEPLSDVTGALLTVGWPSRREAVVHHVIALDAERVPDHLGRSVGVVAVDRLLQAFLFSLGVTMLAVVAYREGWEAVLFLLIFLAIWQLASAGPAGDF